jgi:hypothetical protein
MYDKPVRLLLQEMVKSFDLKPGQVFTTTRAVEWFKEHYPKLQSTGIRADLAKASTNDRSRLHYSVRSDGSDDLLFKVDSGQYRLYEPGKDSAPIHELVEGDVAREEELAAAEEEDSGEAAAGSSEFLLERDLQRYLAENLECIEPGLKPYQSDDVKGFEFEAGGGRRIDILAVDKGGAFVVLELKVSKGYDRVVGQLLRYVNWVRQNLADPGQRVRGIIVCRTLSEDLRLACASITDVELFEYQLSVAVSKVPALVLQGG